MLREGLAAFLLLVPLEACTPKTPDAPEAMGTDAADDAQTLVDGASGAPIDTRPACVPFGARCERNGDCCSENCTVSTTCGMPPAIECNFDGDCPSTMICQTCNHACVFRPGGTCDLSMPCPCGYYCSAGTCDPIVNHPAAQCVSDGDCPIDNFCNRAIFACQVPMFITYGAHASCTANTDCPAGQICSTVSGALGCVTITSVPCITSRDCPASNWECGSGNQCVQSGC